MIYRYYLRLPGKNRVQIDERVRSTVVGRAEQLARQTGQRVEVLREHVHVGPAQPAGVMHVVDVWIGPKGGVRLS